MSLSDLASVASILSSLAVAISLIYLALQVHQNTKHARAAIQQNRVDRLTASAYAIAESDLAAAFLKGVGRDPTADAVKAFQFTSMLNAQALAWMDTFTQHDDGLLNDDQFASHRASLKQQLSFGAVRKFWKDWKAQRPDCHTKFKAFVDEIAAQAERTAATTS